MIQPRVPQEHHFLTHDGVALFYRHWPATARPRRGAIVLLHRPHEHGERMAHLADELDLPDFDVFAWDARGHGRSAIARGEALDFATAVRDLQTFVDHLALAHGVPARAIHVVAEGGGAVLAATWVHDHAPRVRGLTLVSPAFVNRRHAGLRLTSRLRGIRTIAGPGGGALTRDPRRRADHDADPLARQPLDARFLLGLREAAARVVADANAIVRPVQLLVSGADRIAQARPQHRFFDRLGSAHKSRLELPEARHDALGDRDREAAVQAVRAFVLRLIDATPADVDLREAHLRGDTADESQALALPLPLLSPRNLRWSLMRLGIRAGTLSSHGLKLGHATGFDSGAMLDYIYRDQAGGRHALGRRVDRHYLDALGWRALRTRRQHVEELIRDAMEWLAERHRDVRILDIASGPGRYVLDAVKASPIRTSSVLLRDVSEESGREARALIEARELAHVARFELGDAFDRLGLANLRPRPTLAVASGLYELYPANEMVRRSLAGVGDAVEDGGYFIYTNQSWHPQLELIARALVSRREHDGEPWVMRRRTQAEIDQLVEEAGFRKIAMRIDAHGIFTVSLAIRRE